MKITITGHTDGFGKMLSDHLSTDHEVIGISRTTGYDLSTNEGRLHFVSDLSGDIVILNARVSQAETLEAIKYSAWASQPRTVVVVGSRAPDAGLVSQAPLYAAEKAKTDFYTRHAAVEMSKASGTRVILLKPTYISGCKHDDQRCVSSSDLCGMVSELLFNPLWETVRELTLFPLHNTEH